MEGINIKVYIKNKDKHVLMNINDIMYYSLFEKRVSWCTIEVLKALAVLLRSELIQRFPLSKYYTLSKNEYTVDTESDMFSDEEDRIKVREAVHTTKGMIAINSGHAVKLYFTPCCGGATANSEDITGTRINYLRKVICKECEQFHEEKTVKLSEIAKSLDVNKISYKDSIDRIFRDIIRDGEGRIISIKVLNRIMTGEMFMKFFNLSSNRVYFLEDSISLKTIGIGSGLGICLKGACTLEKKGMNFEDIIEHYYTGVKLDQIDEDDIASSLRDKVILIDAGHGGNDTGNIQGGVVEKDVNLEIALLTAKGLESTGAQVILTRDKDENIPMGERIRKINTLRPDIYISLHQNNFSSRGVNGTECYCFSGDNDAIRLGEIICKNLSSSLMVKNRGVRTGDYYMLREAKVSGVIIECMYMTGDMDCRKYKQSSYKSIAECICKSICSYYEIDYYSE